METSSWGGLLYPAVFIGFVTVAYWVYRWRHPESKGLRFFRIDAKPSGAAGFLLSMLLFLIVIGIYGYASHQRHLAEPGDKILPIASKLWEGIKSVAWEKDREDEVRLWVDTWASGKRLFSAYAIIFLAVPFGVMLGVFPYQRKTFALFFTALHKVPALSVLPILFILLGIGEISKITLIVLGIFPGVLLDAFRRSQEIPQEQIYKAKTLGATDLEVAFRVIFPQVFPRALDTIRLSFGPAVLMLIAAEAIAAESGLGYRIFVVRRYMAMDIIIPYVIWMTILLFLLDLAVQAWIKRFRWLDKD